MRRILTIALLLCLAAPASAGNRFPETIPLPNGWQPEGIATGKGNAFYAGSRSAQVIGAAPRYLGNNEPCRFRPPNGAIASVASERIWP